MPVSRLGGHQTNVHKPGNADLGLVPFTTNLRSAGKRKANVRSTQSTLRELVQQNRQQQDYTAMLLGLEEAATQATAGALSQSESLTEPFVAYEVTRTLPQGDGLFLGNSMPIRDVDAFSGSASSQNAQPGIPRMTDIAHEFGARVAANRGASGIDGVISSAAGFAFGLKRPVTLLIGDVSFLHDVNGLNLLRTSEMSSALTIVLVNNGGGGIFDFLPISNEVPKDIFNQLWTTPQNVNLAGICRAHGLPHQLVTQPGQLEPALRAARGLNKHSVVEVVTSRQDNVAQHRAIQEQIKQAVLQASQAQEERMRVTGMRIGHYELPLKAPLTTGADNTVRQGLILEVDVLNASSQTSYTGRGEVAPLPGLHKETLLEAESQLRLLASSIVSHRIPSGLANNPELLDTWLEAEVGVDSGALHPSVRCGLETALLCAVAAMKRLSLREVLSRPLATQNCVTSTDPSAQTSSSGSNSAIDSPINARTGNSGTRDRQPGAAQSIEVNVLVDHKGTTDVALAELPAQLQALGCQSIKVKVGRSRSAGDDGRLLFGLRLSLGPDIQLRADANRAWTVDDAFQFCAAVADAGLEFVEEPLQDPAELQQLCERLHSASMSIPLALDETVDEVFRRDGSFDKGIAELKCVLELRGKAAPISALVLKPAVIGGLARCMAIAQMASTYNIKTVISSAFESSLALSAYSHLALASQTLQPEQQHPAHGLGTSDWFASDIASVPSLASQGYRMNVVQAQALLDKPLEGLQFTAVESTIAACINHQIPIETDNGQYSFSVSVHQTKHSPRDPPMVFLHGFMGAMGDWTAIANGLSSNRDCFVIDLPGHGQTLCQTRTEGEAYSIPGMATALLTLFSGLSIPEHAAIVGYSMGARVALKMLELSHRVASDLILVSPSPQLLDGQARMQRQQADRLSAGRLRQRPLSAFLEEWYAKAMWGNLKEHARFQQIIEQRADGDAHTLAAVLEAASPGFEANQWRFPDDQEFRLSCVAGQLDAKSRGFCEGEGMSSCVIPPSIVKSSGHAVHLQAPLAVLSHIQKHLGMGSRF